MKNNNLIIENAVIAEKEGDGAVNILLRQGVVEKISHDKLSVGGVQKIDAGGKFISPGFIDLHTHLRDPGFTYKEDIISGTAAGAKGGYTAVFAMPNTNPCADNAEVIRYIKDKADTGAKCRVYPAGAITAGQNGESLTDFAELKMSGAYALSDDGKPVPSAGIMRDALLEAKNNDMLVISHCEELSLDARYNSSEDIIIARDLILAAETGARLHIAHISTEGGSGLLAYYKKMSGLISGETCPHYFALNDEAVLRSGVNAKMNPPLRSEKDRLAIIEAIRSGAIDCIATDHAPHSPEDKFEAENDLDRAMNGITGLETAFPLSYTYLVKSGVISLARLIELMCRNPARIANIPCGGFHEGDAADFTVFDTEKKFIYNRSESYSKSRNTPFDGFELYGEVLYTVADGEVMYKYE